MLPRLLRRDGRALDGDVLRVLRPPGCAYRAPVLVPGVARTTAKKLERVKLEFREAILQAREAGESYRDIGEAANLSHPRIVQIVREGAQLELLPPPQ